jgi:DNA-directed RNA polymerase specialized sigma24 family protein
MPGRLARWLTATEPDWDAVYAEQMPRVYNFFRYRFGASAVVEDLTARTFEKAWRARRGYRRDLAGFPLGCSASRATSRSITAARVGRATDGGPQDVCKRRRRHTCG